MKHRFTMALLVTFAMACVLFSWILPVLWRTRRRKRLDRDREDADLIFFRTVNGLMQGGISLPSAILLLSPGRRSPRSLFRERERRTRMNRPLETDSGWDALEFVYRRGLSGTDLLNRLAPLLEERVRLNRRISGLRYRAMWQWGFAAAVPWGLAGLLFFFVPEAGEAQISFGDAAVIAGAMAYQILGGGIAWRIAGFF